MIKYNRTRRTEDGEKQYTVLYAEGDKTTIQEAFTHYKVIQIANVYTNAICQNCGHKHDDVDFEYTFYGTIDELMQYLEEYNTWDLDTEVVYYGCVLKHNEVIPIFVYRIDDFPIEEAVGLCPVCIRLANVKRWQK